MPNTDEQKRVNNLYMTAWRIKNREKVLASKARYRSANKEKISESLKKWRLANPEYAASYGASYYTANSEKIRKKTRDWSKNNPDRKREADRAWQIANPDKTRIRTAKWAKANRAKCNATCTRYRAKQLKATPVWADDFVISEAYELAQLRSKVTGVIHHVDHIVPIRSKWVCGLHCEFNLQVIPGIENQSKSNRFWPDMP